MSQYRSKSNLSHNFLQSKLCFKGMYCKNVYWFIFLWNRERRKLSQLVTKCLLAKLANGFSGKTVLIVNGIHRGSKASLVSLDEKSFSVTVDLKDVSQICLLLTGLPFLTRLDRMMKLRFPYVILACKEWRRGEENRCVIMQGLSPAPYLISLSLIVSYTLDSLANDSQRCFKDQVVFYYWHLIQINVIKPWRISSDKSYVLTQYVSWNEHTD